MLNIASTQALRRSLSSWRAWIEILRCTRAGHASTRSPHGERGLKSNYAVEWKLHKGRSPHGERGLKLVLVDGVLDVLLSLSSWRAWIEISAASRRPRKPRRSPHGERGLKSILFFAAAERVESLSSWRAWIEIQTGWIQWHGAGRSPHGERGLKYRLDFLVELRGSRSPHGERGLKFQDEG